MTGNVESKNQESIKEKSNMQRSLTPHILETEEQQEIIDLHKQPLKVLQIGEGNFLRGFVDWMLQESAQQGLFQGSVAVTQPRPSGAPKMKQLQEQEGLYTLVTRGVEQGETIEKKELISIFSRCIDPYQQWEAFMQLAELASLQFVVSNTTEAGIVYTQEDWQEEQPILSFPGKMAAFLYRRYQYFSGATDRGLTFLPCELLERNGDALRETIIQHAKAWQLPEQFIGWVEEHNQFVNSLVDRIVTGYPEAEAEEWFEEWGYRDALLTTAEPYHFWVLEADLSMDEQLPLQQAGLNVHWVEDIRPYQLRKVKILNGAHTIMTPLALLHGLEEVRETVEHPQFSSMIEQAIAREIIPTIDADQQLLIEYAQTVKERFLNPFIKHRLQDIALNSLSKFKTRLLPTLKDYFAQQNKLPTLIITSFAALLRFYQVCLEGEAYIGLNFAGEKYIVQDDPATLAKLASYWSAYANQQLSLEEVVRHILGEEEIWGQDLREIEGLTEQLVQRLQHWQEKN